MSKSRALNCPIWSHWSRLNQKSPNVVDVVVVKTTPNFELFIRRKRLVIFLNAVKMQNCNFISRKRELSGSRKAKKIVKRKLS